jgi:hypothetical protein
LIWSVRKPSASQPHLCAQALRQNGLDALQKRDRDGAAHAAAVEGENAFGTRTEQMPVTRAVQSWLFFHRHISPLSMIGKRRPALGFSIGPARNTKSFSGVRQRRFRAQGTIRHDP